MKENILYGEENITIDWDYIDSLPEDDVPSDINIIEREMNDLINIQKVLFDKWIHSGKQFAIKMLDYLLSKNIDITNYFEHVCQLIFGESDKTETSITHEQLKNLLIELSLIDREDQNNNDLLLGELTHASMLLEDTENDQPDDFGNIIHEEEEGQMTACRKNFDEMARVIHNVPSIGDTVVVTDGSYKYNFGLVKENHDDGTISILFQRAVYREKIDKELMVGEEYEIPTSHQHNGPLNGIVELIDGELCIVFRNILLKFKSSSLHIQSKLGVKPVQFDIVTLLDAINEDRQAIIKSKNMNTYSVIFLNGSECNVNIKKLKLFSEPDLPTRRRIPIPLFDPPTRDENPIPERESNLFACAFPTLFQTGKGDLNAPRLRDLGNEREDALTCYIRHCLLWYDGRFAHHPRFLYCLFNIKQRRELQKKKSFYLKRSKPTAEDFKPENRKKMAKLMTAYAAHLPTTPGYKLQRRNELENMCEQIQYMTANKERVERLNIEPEYEDYESSDEEESHNTDANTPLHAQFTGPTQEEEEKIKKVHKRPIEGVIPCYWATLTTAPFRSSVISYYINGHHDTDEDVRVRRRQAIRNPHIVAFFSALRLELILKYLMKDMLTLNDWYCVFEWGSGGVLHLHCILWNLKSQHLDNWDLKEVEDKKNIFKEESKAYCRFF